MKIIGIYKITNPNNRIYIGQSSDIIRRKWDYSSLKNCHQQRKIYGSLKKYGWEAHTFEILEECPRSYLDELETWWKHYYGIQCVENGLCCNYWDKKGYKSKETCINISKGRKGVPHTLETKKIIGEKNSKPKPEGFKDKISKANKGKKSKGGIWSKEAKCKFSERLKGKSKSINWIKSRSISIIQYDLYGNFIKEWISATEAAKELNINNTNITSCCKNKHKTAGGYIWKYKK